MNPATDTATGGGGSQTTAPRVPPAATTAAFGAAAEKAAVAASACARAGATAASKMDISPTAGIAAAPPPVGGTAPADADSAAAAAAAAAAGAAPTATSTGGDAHGAGTGRAMDTPQPAAAAPAASAAAADADEGDDDCFWKNTCPKRLPNWDLLLMLHAFLQPYRATAQLLRRVDFPNLPLLIPRYKRMLFLAEEACRGTSLAWLGLALLLLMALRSTDHRVESLHHHTAALHENISTCCHSKSRDLDTPRHF